MYQHTQNNGYAAQQPVNQNSQNFWALDEASAEKAGDSNYIDQTGLYTAIIDRAEYIKASTGTHGMLVRFTVGDQKGSFILNFQKASGEKIYGADFINAMLYLSELQGFSWTATQNEKGQVIQVAREFQGKELGFFLRAEKDKEGRTNLSLFRVYHPRSLHTVTEIKQGKQATEINKIAASLAAV